MNTALLNKIKFTSVDIETRKKLDFRSGDTVRVWSKIAEEKMSTKANKKAEKTVKFRLQAFEGTVLARKHGTESGATFTVRRVASGVGVERIFPLFSPMVDKIELIKKSHARRSKLYYIRTKAIKDVRRKMRSVNSEADNETEAVAKAAE
ncbi:50S ribosomal protein L19 [Candidatus Nomurabacteria bacterium RIFCSPHIGHO2_02_FULL_42_19]|uniref:Large ribosomal subunit protein bL19 n=1 Tax=Candidatus Nomurabacteria bacterium RIFCSPHIGHO2_02_FULL_42_19 TaxID=1801756 RepID=A0A1F6W1C9_9BACT|nr:MAG: 50S ribosomal protein L19 [Candidatus Nomurabacteria bacterium RIFCSPHIGHO2_02_FULL_42_19]